MKERLERAIYILGYACFLPEVSVLSLLQMLEWNLGRFHANYGLFIDCLNCHAAVVFKIGYANHRIVIGHGRGQAAL